MSKIEGAEKWREHFAQKPCMSGRAGPLLTPANNLALGTEFYSFVSFDRSGPSLAPRRVSRTRTVQRSWERLKPVGRAVEAGIGLNRWLARAREEAYSDWLKWLFEQMTAGELIKVLNLRDLDAGDQALAQEPVQVEREVVVEEGHEGQWEDRLPSSGWASGPWSRWK